MITVRVRFSVVILFISLLAAFSLLLVLTTIQNGVEAQDEERLWLNPAATTAFPGGSTNVVLQLDNATNVYGAQIEMSFDPAVVEVVGEEVSPGSCPTPDFVVQNAADNTTGTIMYAVSALSPTGPCDGGDVASIEFACLIGDATSPITITSSIISEPSGIPIVHTTQNGSIECLSNVFEIQGSVSLHGWPDPSGTTVTLNDTLGQVGDPVVVGADGVFNFVAPVDVTYSVEASFDRYLRVEATNLFTTTVGVVIDLGAAVLPAGDLNGDEVINILDITMIAGNFNKHAPEIWD